MLLITCIFIGFFIESIVGFGGLLVSFSILSFFIEVKSLLPITAYIGICASSLILITDRKSISWSILIRKIAPFAFIGTIIGVFLIPYLNNAILLKTFSIFLIIVSFKSLFLAKTNLLHYLQKPLLVIGGVMQGIYGIGGPFTILATQKSFSSKSKLRSTMAVYFIFFNIVRIIQFSLTGTYNFSQIFASWHLIFPLALSIFLGYKIHKKIPEAFFKNIINVFLLLIAITLILK